MQNLGYNLVAEMIGCENLAYQVKEQKIVTRTEVLEMVNRNLDDVTEVMRLLSEAKKAKKPLDLHATVDREQLMERVAELDPEAFKDLTYQKSVKGDDIDNLLTSCEATIEKMKRRHEEAAMFLTQLFNERRSMEEIFVAIMRMSDQEWRTLVANMRGSH